ncbi:MAG: hypothetical protein J0L93_05340 [Deltaproteobacteria bacterium]|nr:hypothetical protein [Deltaproteobacteria bacterium]
MNIFRFHFFIFIFTTLIFSEVHAQDIVKAVTKINTTIEPEKIENIQIDPQSPNALIVTARLKFPQGAKIAMGSLRPLTERGMIYNLSLIQEQGQEVKASVMQTVQFRLYPSLLIAAPTNGKIFEYEYYIGFSDPEFGYLHVRANMKTESQDNGETYKTSVVDFKILGGVEQAPLFDSQKVLGNRLVQKLGVTGNELRRYPVEVILRMPLLTTQAAKQELEDLRRIGLDKFIANSENHIVVQGSVGISEIRKLLLNPGIRSIDLKKN